MGEKNFVYLLGLIKWVNFFTLFIVLSKLFSMMGFTAITATILQLMLVAFISSYVNKWFEKKFGKENLIERTLFFKLLNAAIIIFAVYVLVKSQQFSYLMIIGTYIALFSLVLFLINKRKQL